MTLCLHLTHLCLREKVASAEYKLKKSLSCTTGTPRLAIVDANDLNRVALEHYVESTTAPHMQRLWVTEGEEFRIADHRRRAKDAITKFERAWNGSGKGM